jgi:hypothetical protein
MALDHKAIANQIDTILARNTKAFASTDDVIAFHAMMVSTLRRLAPPGSTYFKSLAAHEELVSKHGIMEISQDLPAMVGLLTALRDEYANGYLQSVIDLVYADVFSDFLEMARYLLEQGYKDPAAVVIGSVLESHFHKLCNKYGLAITYSNGQPRNADTLNADLKGAGAYDKSEQKAVTTWLDLRNKAAHGKYNEYTKEQVALLLENVRTFLQKVPI